LIFSILRSLARPEQRSPLAEGLALEIGALIEQTEPCRRP